MKTQTDRYTKVVLTAIAIFLGILVFKDIDIVTKAHASELNLSDLKIEQVENGNDITFYVYENDAITGGFGKDKFVKKYWYENSSPHTGSKERTEAYIEEKYDFPKYIMTTKTGSFKLKK